MTNLLPISCLILAASSKFTLSLTGPDFTSYKVEDPFKRLGPIAIFSARRHWTAPRCVRLQKGSAMYHDASTSYHCHCAAASANAGADDESHEANCSLYKEELENFGFHVRGDAPVIIAHVEINSLADVSRFVKSWQQLSLIPPLVLSLPAGRHQGGRLHCGDCRHGRQMVFTSAGCASDTILWCSARAEGYNAHGSQLSKGLSITLRPWCASALILSVLLVATLVEGFHINAIGRQFIRRLVRLVQPHQHNNQAQAATEDIRQDAFRGQRFVQFVESLSTHTESGEDFLKREFPSSIREYAFTFKAVAILIFFFFFANIF